MANSDAASTVVGVLFGLLCLGVVSGELDLTSALIADHLVEDAARLGETASDWNDKLSQAFAPKTYTDVQEQELPRFDAPETDCSKAHRANGMLCDAYGHGSSICTGAHAQYNMECDDGNGSPHAKLGEGLQHTQIDARWENPLALGDAQDATTQQPQEDGPPNMDAPPNMQAQDVEGALEPIVSSCSASYEVSHNVCGKQLEDTTLKFKMDAALQAAKAEKEAEQAAAEEEEEEEAAAEPNDFNLFH